MNWIGVLAALAVAAVVLLRRRDHHGFGILLGGALVGALVLLAVSLANDPCFPLCVAAESSRPWFSRVAPPLAAVAWAAVCVAREPLLRRSKAGAWLAVPAAFVGILTAASVAEASVEVVTCHCGW